MAANAEEDDYLSMTFDDVPSSQAPETSLQRTARLKREAASRANQPRKRDLEQQAAKARQDVLDTAMDKSSIGAKMLAKMGFKEGGTLGKSENALKEPIKVNIRSGKIGIGMDTLPPDGSRVVKRYQEELERADDARSARDATYRLQAAEAGTKRQKVSESEYRERAQMTAEERRNQGKLAAAMKVLETLETSAPQARDSEAADGVSPGDEPSDSNSKSSERPNLRSVNILRRRLERDRLEDECQRLSSILKAQAIALRGRAEDSDDLKNPKRAYIIAARIELDESDSELEEFEALSAAEQLEKVVAHLRSQYRYCFWCMGDYPDEGMEGCPGLTEDEHG